MEIKYAVQDKWGMPYANDLSLYMAQVTLNAMVAASPDRGWMLVIDSMS